DFNGDGHPDLVVANQDSDDVSILLGTGTGFFGLQNTFAAGQGPTSVAVGDFNGDGVPDLAVANYGEGNDALGTTVSVLLGTGTGSFGSLTPLTVPIGPWSVAVGDFNEDGQPDLAVTSNGWDAGVSDAGVVSILLGTGAGRFGAAVTFPGLSYPTSVV